MTVTHIVLFRFKDDAPAEAVKLACDNLLKLKTDCLHPTTKAPYILSVQGGRDNSPEDRANGFTHAFVVEFASVADRDYYNTTDPAHQAYKQALGPVLAAPLIVDFTPSQF